MGNCVGWLCDVCPPLRPIYEKMIELGSALWERANEFYNQIRVALGVFFLQRSDIAVCFAVGEALFSKPVVSLTEEGFSPAGVVHGTRAELWKQSGCIPILFQYLENTAKSGRTEITSVELQAAGWDVNRMIREIGEIYKGQHAGGHVASILVGAENANAERVFRSCAERLAPCLFQAMAQKAHAS